MDLDIKMNELTISDEQVESIAFSIFRDIEVYIKQHGEEFITWSIQEIINSMSNLIMTINNGIIEKSITQYNLCKYNIK